MKKLLILIFFSLFFACGPKISEIEKYSSGAKKGDLRDIKKLIQLLEHPDEDIKVKAYQGLINIPDNAKAKTIELTINLLKKNFDNATREFAIGLLGKFKAKSSVPVLIQISKDKNFKRRYVVFSALGEIQDETALDAIIDGLKDEKEDVRKYASRALIKIGPKAIPKMMERYVKEDENTKGYLIRAFGELRNNAPEDLLINDLNGPNKYDVIWALGKTGSKKSLPYLINLLNSDDYKVRVQVCQALGDLNQPDAIPYLRKALKDKEVLVREWAARSLEVLTGERTYYIDQQGKYALPYNIYH
ncbi:MAG: HEAT repeat domain-containing protein [Proteobacteria bacterium]|nr:HEAT repeat domain-containing protein [Pseudomonadota bacterium]